jgi:hypothetical protein
MAHFTSVTIMFRTGAALYNAIFVARGMSLRGQQQKITFQLNKKSLFFHFFFNFALQEYLC